MILNPTGTLALYTIVMRTSTCVALVVLSAAAFGQGGLSINGKKVEVGAPHAVSVGVTEVFWKRDGAALAYYASDLDGTYLGVYDVEKGVAKEMLRFPEGTEVRFEQWLPQRPVYLMVTTHPVGDQLRYVVHSIDVRNLRAVEIWSQQYEKGADVGIDVNASPSLDHALITVTDAEGRHPIVVTEGATNTVYSRDVAKAWQEGMSFAGWSADGTAYFQGAGAASSKPLNVTAADTFYTGEKGTIELTFRVQGNVLSELPIIGLLFKPLPVAPAAGVPVYELMPRNGALRPVLSRGPYAAPEMLPHVVWPKEEEAVVSAEDRLDGTGSIWLVALTGDEAQPYGREGVLVSGERGKSWMCEDGNWIAYETAGALFVRQITYGGAKFSRALFGGR